ncbi:apolipoprotein D-like [Penaeus indicus]|uniref:apolipoprotein D-like n=1 Tax=Penaeus indicus TaxID=29960 RepID=UPI00300D9488
MYAPVILLGAVVGVANSHSFEWGSCKKVNPVANFQADQFTGMWYVIEIFSTTSDCMTMYFNLTDDGSFKVTETREFHPLEAIGLDHRFSNVGTLKKEDGAEPGRFKVSWPGDSDFFGSFGSREGIILDADYTKFAVLMECQNFSLFKRISVVILSRTKSLDSSTVTQIKKDLEEAGYDVDDFDKIDHSTCSSSPDFDVGLDEDGTFSLDGTPLNIPAIPNAGELPIDVIPELNEVLSSRKRR